MPCILKFNSQAVGNEQVFPVIDRLKIVHSLLGIFYCIERQCGFMFGKFSFISPVCIFFLEMAAVAKHDVAKVIGGMGTVNFAGKTLLTQPWQIATVVYMCMG